MSKANDTSAIEREIEETRERLATTIDQLLHRSNPKTIVNREVSQVKAWFVDPETGQPRADHIVKLAAGVLGTVAFFVVVRKVVS
ncbi:DUF3618 domain-containing protein [Nocardioides sp. SYSU D00038]|uniref:DUF3618 domain-containing protein n=1 Tax=Nocardioides sp. SYSU D00038 TaxID=2812554 RepID=UPI0019672D89|nr:DUF3618 domain-containing protein [Nocardioides sp. SYSU D00038]